MSDITLNTQSITGNHNFVPPGTDWNLGSGTKKWNGGYFGTIIADAGIPAGTAATGGDKIGQIRFSINPNIEPGYLALNGQEVNREDYPNLWAWVQQQVGFLVEEGEWQSISTAHNGNVGKYSVGNGSTTFRLPNLGCWVRGGGTAGTAAGVGGNLDAGLPNITGHYTGSYLGIYNTNDLRMTGPFYDADSEVEDKVLGTVNNGGTSNVIGFNASLANAIYGAADTVQPESIVGIWLVKAYHVPVDNMGNTITVNGVAPDENGNITIDAQAQGLPVGFEYFTFNSNVAVGSLPYLGGEYSRSAYADLWSWIQEQPGYLITETEWQSKSQANNGNVPFYSSGDGSTTFRVPSLKCWVKSGSEITEVGSYLEASFPAHKHDIGFDVYPPGSSLYGTKSITNSKHSCQAGWGAANVATESSYTSTEGQGTAVQPESIVGVWCVKAFGTVSNVGNQDVAELSAEVTRVGTQVNEVADSVKGIIDYVIDSYHDGTNWYHKYKSGWVEQGGEAEAGATTNITFLVPMANTNYYIGFNYGHQNAGGSYDGGWYDLKTTGFSIKSGGDIAPKSAKRWKVEGQGAK